MDKSKIHTNHTDGENRQLKGLHNEGIILLECAECGKPLICLQLASIEGNTRTQVLTRVVAKCGLCGGFSYVKQVLGQFYPGAPSDNMVFDILDDDTDAPEADVLFKAWKK